MDMWYVKCNYGFLRIGIINQFAHNGRIAEIIKPFIYPGAGSPRVVIVIIIAAQPVSG